MREHICGPRACMAHKGPERSIVPLHTPGGDLSMRRSPSAEAGGCPAPCARRHPSWHLTPRFTTKLRIAAKGCLSFHLEKFRATGLRDFSAKWCNWRCTFPYVLYSKIIALCVHIIRMPLSLHLFPPFFRSPYLSASVYISISISISIAVFFSFPPVFSFSRESNHSFVHACMQTHQ